MRHQWAEDFLIIWDDGTPTGPRRGWLVRPEPMCSRSRCGCSRVDVKIQCVDDRLLSVEVEGGELVPQWRMAPSDPQRIILASIDLHSGRVMAPSRHEQGEPGPIDDEWAQRLTATLPGAVLETLWQRLERSKGRRADRLAKRPPSSWTYGDLLLWSDIASQERFDVYVLPEGRISAITMFCPAPSCDCREVLVDLRPCDIGELCDEAGRGPDGSVKVRFDGSPPGVEAYEPGAEDEVQAVWDAYVRRWPDYRRRLEDQYERGRRALAGSIARPIADPEPAAQSKQRVQVGRNEPCPCGSGRKYKRCCLQRDRLA